MIPGNCCFCLPLRTSVFIVGLTSMAVSFGGLLVSTSSVVKYLTLPEDLLLQWLLRACYFLDVQGIAFHAILFMLSTLLQFGIVAKVYPLMIPWMGWCPFIIIGIVVQMVTVVVQQPDLVLPVLLFCSMILLFVVHGSIVVAAYYRQVHFPDTVQLRIFNLRDGELPRIVEVPRRMFASFSRDNESAVIEPIPTVSSSTSPLRSQPRQKLSNAYSRFKASVRPSRY